MTGKQILLEAIHGRTTPRPAWAPFVGVHGGFLLEISAEDYLKSAKNIVNGLLRADALYKPDGLPVVFDLQLEAEALGCELKWAAETPPAVASHPLRGKGCDPSILPKLDSTTGRFPVVKEALKTLKMVIGDTVGIYGLVTGPFTLALHLLGEDIFVEMMDNEQGVKTLLEYCAEIAGRTANFYLDNGADIIAVVDPMTSQISPEHFAQFVAEPVNTIFEHIHWRGAPASLFVCGNATRNLEAMVNTTCDNVSVDENIDLAYLRDLAVGAGKSFGGNLQLTACLLLGTEEDVKRDTLRCLDVGANHGFILAPGCDLPYGVPENNLRVVATMVHDDYQREVARRSLSVKVEDKFADIELPNYAKSEAVMVDVVTLNSASCAPCQYMMAAAENAAKEVKFPIIVKEHKITNRHGLAYMTKLGVKAIPTICIQGKPVFSSIIPDRYTLISALEEARERKW